MKKQNPALMSIFLALGAVSAAQVTPAFSADADLRLSSRVTDDSTVALSGSTKLSGRLMVSYSTRAKFGSIMIEIKNGQVESPIFLPLGAGSYGIQVYHCPPSETSCSQLKDFGTVRNRDPRPISQIPFTRNDLFSLDRGVTTNSTVMLSGTLPPDRYLMVLYQNSQYSESDRDGYHSATGTFTQKIYLRHGAGRYELNFFACPVGTGGNCDPIGNSPLHVINNDRRDPDGFLLPSYAVESDDPEIVDIAFSITRDLAPRDAVRAIHDFVTQNISYDVAGYRTGEYKYTPTNALFVLRRQAAVCAGYANLTAALLRAAGFPARVVHGIADPVQTAGEPSAKLNQTCPKDAFESSGVIRHAWNEVFLEGEWLPIDTTWDAGYVNATATEFVFAYKTRYFLDRAALDFNHKTCYIEDN